MESEYDHCHLTQNTVLLEIICDERQGKNFFYTEEGPRLDRNVRNVFSLKTKLETTFSSNYESSSF